MIVYTTRVSSYKTYLGYLVKAQKVALITAQDATYD